MPQPSDLNARGKIPCGRSAKRGEAQIRLVHWSPPLPSPPTDHKLELELIQPNMTQKPVLRGEMDAHALRV